MLVRVNTLHGLVLKQYTPQDRQKLLSLRGLHALTSDHARGNPLKYCNGRAMRFASPLGAQPDGRASRAMRFASPLGAQPDGRAMGCAASPGNGAV